MVPASLYLGAVQLLQKKFFSKKIGGGGSKGLKKRHRRGGMPPPAARRIPALNGPGCRQIAAINWTNTTTTIVLSGDANHSACFSGEKDLGPAILRSGRSIPAVDRWTFLFILSGCGTLP